MTSEATVDIVDVFSGAVSLPANTLQSGDRVFDTFGRQYALLVVARKRNGDVAITRDDGQRDVFAANETITRIPNGWHLIG